MEKFQRRWSMMSEMRVCETVQTERISNKTLNFNSVTCIAHTPLLMQLNVHLGPRKSGRIF